MYINGEERKSRGKIRRCGYMKCDITVRVKVGAAGEEGGDVSECESRENMKTNTQRGRAR